MKMNDVRSLTWMKKAEIPIDGLSAAGIAEVIDGIAAAINQEFGEPMFDDIVEAIADGYIQICEDGIVVWCS